MSSNRGSWQLPRTTGPASQFRADRRRLLRESLDTFVLGSLSTSVGVVVLIALISEIRGHHVGGWFEEPIRSQGGHVIPSLTCAIAAVAGECLGLAGILLARSRERAISPLATWGTTLCMVHMHILFLQHLI
jgi:hypothetical protein